MKLAEQHGYIVVSPLGFSPLGGYGNPLRLPAVFGQPSAAASQRAAVTPARQRELNLSELEVMTALEIVTEEYGADRSRTYLAGHSMGSGGAWHLAARYPERWRRSPRCRGRSSTSRRIRSIGSGGCRSS